MNNKIIKNLKISDYYIYLNYNFAISINELKDYISFDNHKINSKLNLNLYSKKYIGFENSQELENFIKIFDQYNYKNNPLYKFGEEIFPSIESIIIGFFFMLFSLIYIIIFFFSLFNKFIYLRNKILTVFFILKQIIFILSFGEELGLYLWITGKFEKINFNIDSSNYYKNILKLYNERRFQLKFLLSIILLSIGEIFTILGLTLSKNINYYNNDIDSDIKDSVKINTNHIINDNRQTFNNNNNNITNINLKSSENRLLDTSKDNEIRNENKSKVILRENLNKK